MKWRTLRKVTAALLAGCALSACIASEEPLGGKGETAMTYDEVMAVLGPNYGGALFERPEPGSDYERYRILEMTKDDKSIPLRLIPMREGIIIEFPPGAFMNPAWLYGAVLPHPDGFAVYVDEFLVVRALKGERAPELEPARRILGLAREITTPRVAPGNLEYVQPLDLESVMTLYRALAEAGAEPMTVLPRGDRQ